MKLICLLYVELENIERVSNVEEKTIIFYNKKVYFGM